MTDRLERFKSHLIQKLENEIEHVGSLAKRIKVAGPETVQKHCTEMRDTQDEKGSMNMTMTKDGPIIIDIGPAHRGFVDLLRDCESDRKADESGLLQSSMRESRKCNSGVIERPKQLPFYRQFEKRKF